MCLFLQSLKERTKKGVKPWSHGLKREREREREEVEFWHMSTFNWLIGQIMCIATRHIGSKSFEPNSRPKNNTL